jgi:LuxR family maltose regulon positive regulatory protein
MSIRGVPRLPPGLIARPRLLTRLDTAAPLTVLHAPAGYGKTVALAQWATETEEDGVWLRVHEGSAEPGGFVEQLAHALDDFGFLDDRNPLIQAGASLSVSDPWTLLERGLRRIDGPLTLVIDESEHLHDTTGLGILRLLADVPHLSIKTSTRTSNPFTESGIALAVAVTHLGSADLKLTGAETAALLGEGEQSERVRQVLDFGATPALARVVALDADADSDDPGSTVEARIESLLRLRGTPLDARFAAFMQRVALTDAIDVDFAAELTGEADAADLLDRAEREGLGTWNAASRQASGGRSFELSPVFRRIIANYARRELPAQTLRELKLRVARWHQANQRPYPALRIAVTFKDWDLASDIVRENWNEILRGGQGVSDLFANVPLMTLRNLPLITTVLALRANAVGTQRLRALEYFALAIYGARRERATSRPADRALLRTIESAAQRVSGRADPALKAAEDALDILRTMGPEERDRLGRNAPTVYNQVGTTLFYADHTDDALECFRASTAISDAKGLFAGLQGLAMQAGTLAIRGDMPETAQVLAEARVRTWPDGWLEGYPGSFAQVARAWVALDDADPDAAAAALATLDPHRPTIEHWAVLAHLDALVSLLRGEPEQALVRLDTTTREHKARSSGHSGMVASLRHTRSLIELARGDATAATEALAHEPDGPRRRIGRARIALAHGDLDRALQLLTGWEDEASGVSSRSRAEQLALTAGALALADEADGKAEPSASVDTALRRLAAFLRDRGQSLALTLTPVAAVEAMLRATARDGFDADFVARLEQARDLAVIGSRRVRPRLTERELAVARQLPHHASVDGIAAAMSVSRNTVKSQLRALYRKLEVGSREEALRVMAAWDVSAGTRDTA